MNKGRLTETDDLNNVLTSGIYEISAPTTGVLNGKDIQYGILIVFSAGQRIQLLGNGLYGNAYFRTGRDNGRWYDWVSIYWHKIYSKRELGGLLGVSSSTIFKGKGYIQLETENDIDKVYEPGVYAIKGTSYNDQTLLVFSHNLGQSTVQFRTNNYGGFLVFRIKWWNGAWGTWKTVSLT